MEQPATSFLVELLHSVPHINITLHRVNDTFNPSSTVYIERAVRRTHHTGEQRLLGRRLHQHRRFEVELPSEPEDRPA